MGKMKGNRLNTAANTGTFITSRQQLKTQRQIAANTSAQVSIQARQLELMEAQARQADHDRFIAKTDKAVAEGQVTREEADRQTEAHLYNLEHPQPKPSIRVAPPTASSAFDKMFKIGGTPAGWYKQDATTARYWDGAAWTLATMPLSEAQHLIKAEWDSTTSEGQVQKSRRTAGILGVLLGWLGVHRFYLGSKGVGVFQIILFVLLGAATFGLIGLWGVIEGVSILCGAQAFSRDARGVPLAP